MSGNVYEMCWDWKGTITDTIYSYGVSKGQAWCSTGDGYAGIPRRIVRGGSVDYPEEDRQRVIDRETSNTSTMRWNNCGARIVRTMVIP